jgi:hypothetical protein
MPCIERVIMRGAGGTGGEGEDMSKLPGVSEGVAEGPAAGEDMAEEGAVELATVAERGREECSGCHGRRSYQIGCRGRLAWSRLARRTARKERQHVVSRKRDRCRWRRSRRRRLYMRKGKHTLDKVDVTRG